MGAFSSNPQKDPDTWVIERTYGTFNVKFIKGDVVKQDTDVLINSIGKNILKGFVGPLAIDYLKEFGEVIKANAKKANNNNEELDYGGICHSKIGEKRYLTHCALPEWGSKD